MLLVHTKYYTISGLLIVYVIFDIFKLGRSSVGADGKMGKKKAYVRSALVDLHR
jgi:hypothetical protein